MESLGSCQLLPHTWRHRDWVQNVRERRVLGDLLRFLGFALFWWQASTVSSRSLHQIQLGNALFFRLATSLGY